MSFTLQINWHDKPTRNSSCKALTSEFLFLIVESTFQIAQWTGKVPVKKEIHYALITDWMTFGEKRSFSNKWLTQGKALIRERKSDFVDELGRSDCFHWSSVGRRTNKSLWQRDATLHCCFDKQAIYWAVRTNRLEMITVREWFLGSGARLPLAVCHSSLHKWANNNNKQTIDELVNKCRRLEDKSSRQMCTSTMESRWSKIHSVTLKTLTIAQLLCFSLRWNWFGASPPTERSTNLFLSQSDSSIYWQKLVSEKTFATGVEPMKENSCSDQRAHLTSTTDKATPLKFSLNRKSSRTNQCRWAFLLGGQSSDRSVFPFVDFTSIRSD